MSRSDIFFWRLDRLQPPDLTSGPGGELRYSGLFLRWGFYGENIASVFIAIIERRGRLAGDAGWNLLPSRFLTRG